MTRVRFLIVSAVLISFLVPHAVRAQTPSVPRFESAACPFKLDPTLKEGKDVRCGFLVVPENRSVSNGKTIKLAVAIVKAASAHPAPDPVVLLNGGPGGDTIVIASQIGTSSLDDWVNDRDMILIDQRGTGYSQPVLACPENFKMAKAAMAKRYTFQQEDALEAQAVAACRARLAGEGIDLSAYTTVENAADIADLRTALGYKEVNLYGLSYGTRLALTVMRYFPQGIRSVVLDSVYGPGINFYTDPLRSGARDINLVLDSCAKSSGCKRLYPHARKDLYTLVKKLDKKPPTTQVTDFGGTKFKVVVTGEVLLNSLFSSLYDQGFIPQIPDLIHGALKHVVSLKVLVRYGLPLPTGFSMGMFLSIECSEDAPGTTPTDIDAAGQALPAQLRADMIPGRRRSLHDCEVWNVPGVPAVQKQPVISDIPTMVMEGEFDPITPPAYGATVAGTLSHSYSFDYPGLAHRTRFNYCPATMMWAFVDNPTQKPDSSCISGMQEPFPR